MIKKTPKTLKKRYLVLAATFIVAGYTANAQQVTATAGETHQTGDMSISWTLGEGVIQTFQNENMTLTQGVHQPTLSVVGVEQPMELAYTIEAWPNPASKFVNLRIGKPHVENMEYLLYDFIGNLVRREKIEADQTRISFEGLPTAVYFIRVAEANKEVKIFKIVKTQ